MKLEKNIQYEYERTAVICMFSKIISYPSRLETWSLHEQASDIWRGVKAISVPLLLLTDTMHCNHVDIIYSLLIPAPIIIRCIVTRPHSECNLQRIFSPRQITPPTPTCSCYPLSFKHKHRQKYLLSIYLFLSTNDLLSAKSRII